MRIRAAGISMPRLQVANRAAAGNRLVHYIFQRHLEMLLFKRDADGGSSGPIWKYLNMMGMGSSTLHVSASAVQMNQLTKEEYVEIMSLFKASAAGIDPSVRYP